jgi:hypothetical protein
MDAKLGAVMEPTLPCPVPDLNPKFHRGTELAALSKTDHRRDLIAKSDRTQRRFGSKPYGLGSEQRRATADLGC